MKLLWLKFLVTLFFLITVLGALLFSRYLVSSSSRSPFLHAVAFEARAMSRDAETQWIVIAFLVTYGVTFLVLERQVEPGGLLPTKCGAGPAHFWNGYVWLGAVAVLAFTNYLQPYHGAFLPTEPLVLLTGMTLGKGALVWILWPKDEKDLAGRTALVCRVFVFLLATGGCWHPEIAQTFQYRGQTRWFGPWGNPNSYGVLMGVGIVLAVGQLVLSLRPTVQSDSSVESRIRSAEWWHWIKVAFLLSAAGVCGFGLIKSYSRGAWVGAAIALAYLGSCWSREKAYLTPVHSTRHLIRHSATFSASDPEQGAQDAEGQSFSRHSRDSQWLGFVWRNWLPASAILISVLVLAFWNFRHTERVVVRRAMSVGNVNDFSWRNRVTTYEGALQMMSDKPWFGFGWNQPEPVYYNFYQPEKLVEGMAIQMNDYFMLGMTLGLPALACFVTYVWLSFGRWARAESRGQLPEAGNPKSGIAELDWLQTTCRAGAVVLLVGFWFDGGLFKLATAAPFWILLELGRRD